MNVTIKKISFVLLSFVTLVVFQNCAPFEGTGESVGSTSDVDFYVGLQTHVLGPKCLTCHGSVNPAGDVNLSSFSAIMTSNVVNAGNASTSLMYTALVTPLIDGHENMESFELQGIEDWINAGALENEIPTLSAGVDRSITLPVSSVTLEGAAQDRDGTIVSYLWTRTSGPNTPQFQNSMARVTQVTGLVQGTYVFRLRVTDNGGAMADDTVSITVLEAGNVLPIITTGGPRRITLPTNSISIEIQATDSDGTIASYAWDQAAGPTTATLTGTTTAILNASNLVAGAYQFRIRVTDNRAGVTTAFVVVNVDMASAVVTYTQVRNNVFVQCTACHGNSGGYNMSTYNNVRTRVTPNDAGDSVLYQRVLDNSMPPGNPLSNSDKNLVRDWINSGALNN